MSGAALTIDSRKVVAQYDDMTNGGTSRFALAGNDSLPKPWAVIHLRRVAGAEPVVLRTQTFGSASEARRAFLNRVAQYVPEGLSADPRYF